MRRVHRSGILRVISRSLGVGVDLVSKLIAVAQRNTKTKSSSPDLFGQPYFLCSSMFALL